MHSRKEIVAVYNRLYDETFRALDDEAEKKFGQRYTEIHKWRIIRDVQLLPPVRGNGRILEIGPSMTSLILKELTGATVETLCIDELNRNFLEAHNIPLHLCDLNREDPDLPSESYDLILFCEVFEHFELAPESALRRILGLLKPNGRLFFSVPNFATIEKRVAFLRGENPQDLLSDTTAYYAHLREPVYGETRDWWEKAGATILRQGFTNYDERESGGFLSKLVWTGRFLKIRNWYGMVHVWFPHTRHYFYFLLSK